MVVSFRPVGGRPGDERAGVDWIVGVTVGYWGRCGIYNSRSASVLTNPSSSRIAGSPRLDVASHLRVPTFGEVFFVLSTFVKHRAA